MSKHFLKCLLQLVHELKLVGITFARLQTSHEDILLLDRRSDVDWNLFQIKRKLARDLCGVSISWVSFSLNKPAEALCFSDIRSLRTTSYGDLTSGVHNALLLDDLPHPCSLLEQIVYL